MSEFDTEFELLGEPEVRRRMVSKQGLHVTRWAAAESWLALKESGRTLRAEDSDVSRSAREEETLAIAKDANRLASEANEIARREAAAAARAARYAMYAALIAATSAIIAAKAEILPLIFG
ncbi:MAG: hypothetical protein U1A72_05685 [Sulfuritalea sp.]|nr:hypothetical protein [Sulfuritalea sp.]